MDSDLISFLKMPSYSMFGLINIRVPSETIGNLSGTQPSFYLTLIGLPLDAYRVFSNSFDEIIDCYDFFQGLTCNIFCNMEFLNYFNIFHCNKVNIRYFE